MEWVLWIDFHRTDSNGLTHKNIRDACPGVEVIAGNYLVVGNEEAEPAVIAIRDKGTVLVQVLPAPADR